MLESERSGAHSFVLWWALKGQLEVVENPAGEQFIVSLLLLQIRNLVDFQN